MYCLLSKKDGPSFGLQKYIQRPNTGTADFVAAETLIFGRNVDPPRQEETVGNNCGCNCHQAAQAAQSSSAPDPQPSNEGTTGAQFVYCQYRSVNYGTDFCPLNFRKLKIHCKK